MFYKEKNLLNLWLIDCFANSDLYQPAFIFLFVFETLKTSDIWIKIKLFFSLRIKLNFVVNEALYIHHVAAKTILYFNHN